MEGSQPYKCGNDSFLLKRKVSNLFTLTGTISDMSNSAGWHFTQTNCETKSVSHKVSHLRPLEHSRRLAIPHFSSPSRTHTHRCTHTHTQKHKCCPTLFGLSSRSTTLQISDELLQSPLSVTLQPQFDPAIPRRQLILTFRLVGWNAVSPSISSRRLVFLLLACMVTWIYECYVKSHFTSWGFRWFVKNYWTKG